MYVFSRENISFSNTPISASVLCELLQPTGAASNHALYGKVLKTPLELRNYNQNHLIQLFGGPGCSELIGDHFFYFFFHLSVVPLQGGTPLWPFTQVKRCQRRLCANRKKERKKIRHLFFLKMILPRTFVADDRKSKSISRSEEGPMAGPLRRRLLSLRTCSVWSWRLSSFFTSLFIQLRRSSQADMTGYQWTH